MSIKQKLFMFIAALGILVITFTTSNLRSAWNEKQQLEMAYQGSETINLFLEASEEWSLERRMTEAALSSAMAAPESVIDIIEMHGEKADAAFKQAVAQLSAFNFPKKSLFIRDAEQAHKDLVGFRLAVKSNLEKSQFTRDASVQKNWFPVISKAIVKSQDLRFALSKQAALINPELGRQTQLKHSLWIVGEYIQREQSLIGAMIKADVGISEPKLIQLSKYAGVSQVTWNMVKKLSDSSGASVMSKVTNARKYYEEEFTPLQNTLIQNAIDVEDFVVSEAEWNERTQEASRKIQAVQSASYIETKSYLEQQMTKASALMMQNLLTLIICLFVVGLTIYIVKFEISNALDRVTRTMKALTAGKINTDIPETHRTDEIGELANGLQKFKESLILQEEAREKEEAHKKEQEAARDKEIELERERMEIARLQNEKEVERSKKIDFLLAEFSNQIGTFMSEVSDSVHNLQGSSQSLAALAEQTGAGAEMLTAQTKSMNNVMSEIKGATVNLGESFQVVEGSLRNTENMIDHVTDFVNNADQITENFMLASRKVTKAVDLISSIANQINLLSLNAGIESARAGEAGKGFTVVASEVKALANKTGDSVTEINGVIQDMCVVSETMVQTLKDIGASMTSVRNAATEIDTSLSDQRQNSDEITKSISDSSEISKSVAVASSELAQGAMESSNVSCNVNAVSDQLAHKSKNLKKFIDNFLSEVRAV